MSGLIIASHDGTTIKLRTVAAGAQDDELVVYGDDGNVAGFYLTVEASRDIRSALERWEAEQALATAPL